MFGRKVAQFVDLYSAQINITRHNPQPTSAGDKAMKDSVIKPVERHAFLVSIFLILGVASGAAYGDTAEIKGSYHTTVTEQGAVPANDYNEDKTKIKVDFTVKVKVDPKTGKKEFDLANSSATFENEFPTSAGTPFKTTPIPITSVKGDPNTGMVDSFTVKSDKAWDPARPTQSNGLSGEVDLKNKKANLKSSYTSGGAKPTITSYTFATDNEKPGPAKKDAKTGKPVSVKTEIPNNGSITYDAVSGILSIHDDTVVDTPVSTDPILGAAVNFPDFQFTGFTTGGELAIFWPGDDELFTMTKDGEVFEQSDNPVLFFDVLDNLFWGALGDTTFAGMSPNSPFFNPGLSSISSPFLDSLASVLDPLSPDFDPFADFFISIFPEQDFMTLTDAFTKSGSSGASDLHFVARPVPEPSTMFLVAAGCIGLLVGRWMHSGYANDKRSSKSAFLVSSKRLFLAHT